MDSSFYIYPKPGSLQKTTTTNRIDYLLVGIVIALTGFEVLFRASIYLEVLILSGIAIYFFRYKTFKIDFFLILIPFILPAVFQAFKFNLYGPAVRNIISTAVNLLICYMVIEIVKERFNITFVNFVYFLAIFSLIFYPTQFFPSLEESIKNSVGSLITPVGISNVSEGFKTKTLIFFTYGRGSDLLPYFLPRNCGAFWEPGMFTVFLNLALLTNLFVNKTKILTKKNIVLIIAIITTLSTTGFIALFLIILSYMIINFQQNRTGLLVTLPIIIGFIYISYTYIWNLEFMSSKVNLNVSSGFEDRKSTSRFGAVLYHFEQLKQFPLGGVSIKHYVEVNELDPSERRTSPNGLSLVFFVFGLPVGILYFVLFISGISRWLTFNQVNIKLLHFFFPLIFLLLAFSQDVTCRLFYIMFLFFPLCLSRITQPFKQETNLNIRGSGDTII